MAISHIGIDRTIAVIIADTATVLAKHSETLYDHDPFSSTGFSGL